ncbi:hypothetical protein Hdeb2414_s0001g00015831 [Helianthus debilis subsp. tardiflorus]
MKMNATQILQKQDDNSGMVNHVNQSINTIHFTKQTILYMYIQQKYVPNKSWAQPVS